MCTSSDDALHRPCTDLDYWMSTYIFYNLCVLTYYRMCALTYTTICEFWLILHHLDSRIYYTIVVLTYACTTECGCWHMCTDIYHNICLLTSTTQHLHWHMFIDTYYSKTSLNRTAMLPSLSGRFKEVLDLGSNKYVWAISFVTEIKRSGYASGRYVEVVGWLERFYSTSGYRYKTYYIICVPTLNTEYVFWHILENLCTTIHAIIYVQLNLSKSTDHGTVFNWSI